jgi:hypothetical protein
MVTDRTAGRRRLLAVVALSALVGVVCAALNSGVIGVFPPKVNANSLQIAAATAYVDVDLPAPAPPLAQARAVPPQDPQTLIKRAELLGRIMVSPPSLEGTARRCQVSPDQLSGLARATANVPLALMEPDSERRASDIEASKAPYRLEVQARPTRPVIDVYAQAPSVGAAECLANAATLGLTDYLRDLGRSQGRAPEPLIRLQQLGPARGGVVNGGAALTIAILTFVTAFGLSIASLLGAGWLRRRLHASRSAQPAEPLVSAAPMAAPAGDAWPRTTRLLPWTLAGFIALLWLTPFNAIKLNASLPIDLQLDRLVLPVVAVVWLLALATGGRFAPRLRMTWVHAALGALLACALLSIVTDARYLNQTLELELSLKKLPLTVTYVSLFVIAASAVRRTEVRAFMTYTLGLAVVCALGMIWEYRMKQNLFWDLSDSLLPGIFKVEGALDAGAVDHIGRRVVRGPAEVPLEAVAMLTMALPIGLVGILHTRRWWYRILYGLALCALVAATFATYRKSALIAPFSVILTLAYFRRRELLKLAPLGLVLLVVVTSLSPGALGSTISQFTRSDRASVPTVNDRASDYDAVRPDVWSHLALGRGWGSYNHDSYRILDSEILLRTIETGVLGLAAFLLLGLSVVACSRKTIASRDPATAPVALIGASIAVGFLVLATLMDELSFPHAVYIFLYMVGFEAVILERRGRDEEPTPAPSAADPSFDEPEWAPARAAEAPLVSVR